MNIIETFKIFMDTPFSEKDIIKKHGAMWCASKKRWFFEIYKSVDGEYIIKPKFDHSDSCDVILSHTCGFRVCSVYINDVKGWGACQGPYQPVDEIFDYFFEQNKKYNERSHVEHAKKVRDAEYHEINQNLKEEKIAVDNIIEKLKQEKQIKYDEMIKRHQDELKKLDEYYNDEIKIIRNN